MATYQLFLISNSKFPDLDLIVKEGTKKEALNLMHDKYGEKAIQPFVYPATESPILMLPDIVLKYSYNNKEHFMLIMPKASGVELRKFTEYYVCAKTEENRDNIIKRAQKAYNAVGTALAKFQKSLDGFVHGDFHYRNVMFDESTGKVYMIDLESLHKTDNNKYRDLPYLIRVSTDHKNLIFSPKGECAAYPDAKTYQNIWDMVSKEGKDKFVAEITKSLISGYIDEYTNIASDKPNLLSNLKKAFSNHFGMPKDIDPALEQAFKELQSTYGNS